MCGRYSFVPSKKQQAAQLDRLEAPAPLTYRYNIAPTQHAPVVSNQLPKQLQFMQWGLVPFWSKDGQNSGRLINARAESLLEKPSFQEPARQRRCIVPADSFYEWKTLPGRVKAPYRIFRKDEALLFLAGIWDEWKGANGLVLRTFSIVTTTPNEEMSHIHNRMPLILPNEDAQLRWLNYLDDDGLKSMLLPAPDGLLEMYRVSEKLNKAGYEGGDLHEKVTETATLFD